LNYLGEGQTTESLLLSGFGEGCEGYWVEVANQPRNITKKFKKIIAEHLYLKCTQCRMKRRIRRQGNKERLRSMLASFSSSLSEDSCGGPTRVDGSFCCGDFFCLSPLH
jgi:hypothetical protein